MKYQMIFFDADGTLFDFDRSERHSFAAACADQGIPASPGLYEQYRAINAELWRQLECGEIDQSALRRLRFEKLFSETGISGDAASMNRCYSRRLSECTFLIDGALDICRALHGKCPLVIVTNGIPDIQAPRLKKSALAPYIDHVFISGEIGWQKPHPAFFNHVFRQLNMQDEERGQTILLGDSLSSDMKGGHDAGMTTCLYAPQGGAGNETCDFSIRNLMEFLPLVLD